MWGFSLLTTKDELCNDDLEFNKIRSVDREVADLEIKIQELLKSVEKSRDKLRKKGIFI